MSARLSAWALVLGSAAAVAGFAWPFFAAAAPPQAQAALPWVALALVPALVVALAVALDRGLVSARTIALLGVLAAIGAAVRVAGGGIGGVEPVFIVLVLAGRALGARFGFLLGVCVIAVSSAVTGGFGPWTPFQMFACAWVAAGAGLLPAIRSRTGELVLLAAYGAVASIGYGLVSNLWFWPFAVGFEASIAYDPAASAGENLASFWLYSLATSTLTWDVVRAFTTVLGVSLLGRPVLAALRRAGLPGAGPRPGDPSTTIGIVVQKP
ncbi:MAG: ECF transporter S component [Microbacteriaceae bacterium]|nr:ECF transporter S component [Microbacteriaceae bacterium]